MRSTNIQTWYVHNWFKTSLERSRFTWFKEQENVATMLRRNTQSAAEMIRISIAPSSNYSPMWRLPQVFHEGSLEVNDESSLGGSLLRDQNRGYQRCESLGWPWFCLLWLARNLRPPGIQECVQRDNFQKACRMVLEKHYPKGCVLNAMVWYCPPYWE